MGGEPRADHCDGAAAHRLPDYHGDRADVPHHWQFNCLPGAGSDPCLRVQGIRRFCSRSQRFYWPHRADRTDRDQCLHHRRVSVRGEHQSGSAVRGLPRHRLRRSDACGPIGGTRPFDSVCDWHCKYRPSLSDWPWRAVLVGLRGGHYHRRLDWLPEWGPVLQAARPGADRYTRDRFCRGRPSSNCHQYRLSVQRQRFRDGAVLALQSRSHERQHVRIERAADNSALASAVDRRGHCAALFRLWPLHLRARRQPPIGDADRDIRIQILGSRLLDLRRFRGAHGSPFAGLERWGISSVSATSIFSRRSQRW